MFWRGALFDVNVAASGHAAGKIWIARFDWETLETSTMISEISTVIADGADSARKKLRQLLYSEVGVRVIEECGNTEDTIAAVQDYEPDLLLVNVAMTADGLWEKVDICSGEGPIVVFTGSKGQRPISSLRTHAVDHLIEPFDQETVHRAIESVRAALSKAREREITRRNHDLLANASVRSETNGRMVIRTTGRIVFLDVDEIIWMQACCNYLKIFAGNREYLVRDGIGKVWETLDPEHFVRIHRSTIVNVCKIRELQPCNSGEYIVVLRNGKELSCSRGYRKRLDQLIRKRCWTPVN